MIYDCMHVYKISHEIAGYIVLEMLIVTAIVTRLFDECIC